ncbi:MAG: alanine--tRNA ligase [Bacillota bacterium]|jgi:alanyl-tRNA synthetase
MTGKELREKFLKFFEGKGHKIVPSSSLVPHNDPTLLFTNAGMVQFKNVFLGLEQRPYSRAVTAQKCVRAGGKHNDLDTVGRTARHHTFFEMLGNFSFGDYFKKEAISYAWEFLTEELHLPKDKLYITVFYDDNEAYNLWLELTGVPENHIIRLGEKDNFWSMGDTGPCGPCSEILIDRGEHLRCNAKECGIGKCDCDRWLEIWNLVFMQFNRDDNGIITSLPTPSIDTGMGLERVASVVQNVPTNYDTDLLKELINYIEKAIGKTCPPDERGFPFRVIADHARSCSFLVADGVLPSNEGRGYVLRRILRRAVRFVKVLGREEPFLCEMVPSVVRLMGDAYPEIKQKQEYIQKVIRIEEERFHETLSDGMKVAADIIERIKAVGHKELTGSDAFLLYDTYGFPIDLTEDIAEENGITVDKAGFEAAMDEQRKKARAARNDSKSFNEAVALVSLLTGISPTVFLGYESYQAQGKILGLLVNGEKVHKMSKGEQGYLVLDQTPLYAESGGQVGDTGRITNSKGKGLVVDTQKLVNGVFLHRVILEEGSWEVGDMVEAVVDQERRHNIARNHTATHLIHKVLKTVIGEHANQSGSLVEPDRLRFDFSHFTGLSKEELIQVEDIVNQAVLNNLPVTTIETDLDKAKEMGATALFGEKYGDKVRIVKIGEFSMELCGGTHCRSTGEIGLVKLLSEEGIGAGLRRVEAITGNKAREYLIQQEFILGEAAQALKTMPHEVVKKVELLLTELKSKEKEIEQYQAKIAKQNVIELLSEVREISGVKILVAQVHAPDMNALRSMADLLRDKLGSGVIVLGAITNNKVNFVAMVTPDLKGKGLHAGNILRETAKVAGGGGGGRPDMAQAGGKDPDMILPALDKAWEIIQAQLG